MVRTYLLPVNWHFLGSLVKLYHRDLKEKGYFPTEIVFVFPTKRAGLYFKHLLAKQSLEKSFIFPRILSWEEFFNLAVEEWLPEVTFKIPSPSVASLILLKVLKELKMLIGKPEEDIYWTGMFLQVLEELAWEGLEPRDILYSPEGLPKKAQEFLENLSKCYQRFRELFQELGYYTKVQIWQRIGEELNRYPKVKPSFRALYLCGFAGLKKVELNLWQGLQCLAKNGLDLTIVFASAGGERHPLLANTLRRLNLEAELFPEDCRYERKIYSIGEKTLEVWEALDVHQAVEFVVEKLKNELPNLAEEVLPEYLCVVVPNSDTLLPFLKALQEIPEAFQSLNVSQSYPLTYHPLNTLLLQIIELHSNQKLTEKGVSFPLGEFSRLLSHPLLKRLYPVVREKVIKERMEVFILSRALGDYFTLAELKNALAGLPPFFEEELAKFYQVFFEAWERKSFPRGIAEVIDRLLKDFEERGLPKKEIEDDFSWTEYLAYKAFLKSEVLPLFLQENLWTTFLTEEDYFYGLSLLKDRLERAKHYLMGEPLRGLQVLGFLETRLLNFKKVFLIDFNEGILPPRDDFNPLLTNELRTALGLPIYSSALWDYYFKTFVDSLEEGFFVYLYSSEETALSEPSRFVHWLRYTKLKAGHDLPTQSLNIPIPPRKEEEGIPKKEEHQQLLIQLLSAKEGISRSFFETYFKCPAKFYFKYLLNLKEKEDSTAVLGQVVHEVFQNLLTPFHNREIVYSDILPKIPTLLDRVWENRQLRKHLDPLSEFLSKELIKSFLEKYFYSLKSSGEKRIVLGVEKRVETFFNLPWDGKSLTIKVYGITDLQIERHSPEGREFLLLDLKTGSSAKILFQKADGFTRLLLRDGAVKYGEAPDWGLRVKDWFGSKLENFQLYFYLYLLLNEDRDFSNFAKISMGLIRITLKEKYEQIYSFGKRELEAIKENFPEVLIGMLRHILEGEKFSFHRDRTCAWCGYYEVCLGFRSGRGKLVGVE